MLKLFWAWICRRYFTATVIAHGSKVMDDLRGEIKRNVNVLLMNLNISSHARACFEEGVVSYITNDRKYEWRFYLVDDSVAASCKHNFGEWIFSTTDKDTVVPLRDVVAVHKSLTELNAWVAHRFGGMTTHLRLFADADAYRK